MGFQKDKGYAWVVVAASAYLMLTGPSTYTCFGFLLIGVDTKEYHNWIINALCAIWFLTGFLAGPMSSVSTHRKLAMIGCGLACCGFLLSSAALNNPLWLLLTFSVLVGFGLGLAIHISFLVVALNFEKHIGLANGIGQISLKVGHMTAPLLYSIMDSPREKLQIRALLTAVALLSASFYVGHTMKSHSTPTKLINGSGPRRRSTNSENEDVSNCDSLEAIPLVELKEETNGNCSSVSRPIRRRSQYLSSTPMLPKIPEEVENYSLNEISATIDSTPPPQVSNGSPPNSVENNNQCEDSSHIPSSTSNTDEVPIKTASYESNPTGMKNNSINSKQLPRNGVRKYSGRRVSGSGPASTYRIRSVRAMRRYKNEASINLVFSRNKNSLASRARENLVKYVKDVFSQLDLKLFTNYSFLNMSVCSSLILLVMPSFSVVIYSYVSLILAEEEEREMVLLIIYSLDVIACLIFSYLSDFSLFNRRLGFFGGILCSTIVLTCIGFVTDGYIIYCMCAAYGISTGVMTATESLMFVDAFGIKKLPSTYAVVNLIKFFGLILTTSLLGSPGSVFTYTVHPYSYVLKYNATICENCDPLGSFIKEDYEAAILRKQNMLCVVAIPSIICLFCWTVEAVWKIILRKVRCEKRSALAKNTDNFRTQV